MVTVRVTAAVRAFRSIHHHTPTCFSPLNILHVSRYLRTGLLSLEVRVDRILAYAPDRDAPEYDRMVDALKTVRVAHSGEPVVFSLCEWGWVRTVRCDAIAFAYFLFQSQVWL